MNETATISELLAALAAAPNDLKLRERTARMQLLEGDVDGSLKTLADRVVNVTAHVKGSPLPSLHRKAMRREQTRVELDGEVFVRDFVCAAGRVLFFWLPESLSDNAEQVRDSVRSSLKRKLNASDKKQGRAVADSEDDDSE
jgi:hypothetical protein